MSIMSWLIWLIIGLASGWLANMILGTKVQHHLLLDVLCGTVGAMLGGALFVRLSPSSATEFNIWSLFAAFTSAVIMMGLLRLYIQIMGIHPTQTGQ